MDTAPIVIERTYDATASIVWAAITDRDKMKQWYFDIETFKPDVGFEFHFYGANEGRKFKHLCKITEVVPGKKLVHSWRYDGYPGISYVAFELFEEGGKTRVRLTHEGLESFPVTEHNDFAKENFVQGWTYIFGDVVEGVLGAVIVLSTKWVGDCKSPTMCFRICKSERAGFKELAGPLWAAM